MHGRRHRLIAALGAAALSIPVGYAVGHDLAADESPPEQVGRVDAAACAPEVRQIFEDASVEIDGFLPGCPSAEEARNQAEEILRMRREYEEGQARIAELRESGRLQEVDGPSTGFED